MGRYNPEHRCYEATLHHESRAVRVKHGTSMVKHCPQVPLSNPTACVGYSGPVRRGQQGCCTHHLCMFGDMGVCEEACSII